MLGCRRVKFGCRQNLLKVEIWDLQIAYINDMYSWNSLFPYFSKDISGNYSIRRKDLRIGCSFEFPLKQFRWPGASCNLNFCAIIRANLLHSVPSQGKFVQLTRLCDYQGFPLPILGSTRGTSGNSSLPRHGRDPSFSPSSKQTCQTTLHR